MGDFWTEDIVRTTVANQHGYDRKEHPAPFPDQIVVIPLLQTTKENDLVLDPFHGSGTTGRVATHYDRRFRQSRKSLVNIDPKRRKIKVRNRKEFINTSQIEKLNLKLKTIQILRKNAIMTLRDLTRTSRIELLRINGLGNSVFKEIESCLKEFGLRLAPSKKESVVDIRTLSLQQRRPLRRPGAKKRLKIEKRARYLAKTYD